MMSTTIERILDRINEIRTLQPTWPDRCNEEVLSFVTQFAEQFSHIVSSSDGCGIFVEGGGEGGGLVFELEINGLFIDILITDFGEVK